MEGSVFMVSKCSFNLVATLELCENKGSGEGSVK